MQALFDGTYIEQALLTAAGSKRMGFANGLH